MYMYVYGRVISWTGMGWHIYIYICLDTYISG